MAQEGFLYPEVPELANVVDLMGRGILFADVVSTVSPRYAREILTPEFGERLDSLAARAQRPPLRHPQRREYGGIRSRDRYEHRHRTYDAFSLEKRRRQ